MIDRYLDPAEVCAHLKPFYSHTGRPSVDPELIISMLIIGYWRRHSLREKIV